MGLQETNVKFLFENLIFSNPTPDVDSELQHLTWSVFDNNETYLDIGYNLSLRHFPAKNNMTFWDKFYKKYAHYPLSTF